MAVALLGPAGETGALRAAEPPPPAVDAPPSPEYRSVSRGAVADFGYGSSAVGDSLLGELGAQSVGIQSFRDHALLVQWDGLLAARGGILGNTHPYTELVGGHVVASAEAGRRWQPRARWSVYTGAGLAGDLSLMTNPGTSYGDLDTLNDLDGVGGLSARGALRVDGGASLLDGPRSLLLVAVLQEALRASGIYTPGVAFTQAGLAVRWDVARRLTVSLEGLAGWSPATKQAALDTTDQKTELGTAAVVRKIFTNGMWLAATSALSREFDHRVYAASATAYDTANAPTFTVTLLYGIPLGCGRAAGSAKP